VISVTTAPSHLELRELKKRLAEVQSLKAASALLYWDQSTLMPERSGRYRGEHLSAVERVAHEKATAPEIGRLLERLTKVDLGSDASAALVRVAREDYDRLTRLPADFVEHQSAHLSRSYLTWVKARAARDFKAVIEPLKKTLDLSREYSSYFSGFQHVADPLIDANDSGATVRELRPLFSRLRAELVPLFNEITEHPPFDNRCLLQPFDEHQQLEFGKKIISRMGYDFSRGRQDKTAHPFMIRFSTDDVRITTRVKANDLGEALFSTIHEAGHALYELGIDPQHEGTPLASGTSAGIHESQSRLWENLVARGLPFWRYFYPELQSLFPQQLGAVPLQTFYRAINRVEPSLIRTDADEVSYNLHVMIRFDLELDMLEGKLRIEDLRDAWNARYESDLGITPPHDGNGVLQDVHWYSGLIGGTFQGYTLGNIMSAQFFETAHRALPDLDEKISRGELSPLREWLRERIHDFGRSRTASEIMVHATGRSLEIAPYLRYLNTKYRSLLTDD